MDTRFFFAQVTDTHIGRDGYQERLSSVIRDLNNSAEDIRFVVFTGDIADNASNEPEWAEFRG